MNLELADWLAGPNGMIGERVVGVGVVGDELVLEFEFKGTDDGDLTLRVPIRETVAEGLLVDLMKQWADEEDDDSA